MPASLSKSLRAKRSDLIIPTSQLLTTLLATKSAKVMTCYDSPWCIIHICPNLGGWGVLLLLSAVSRATEWDLLSLRWLFSRHQDNFYLDKRTMGEVDIPVFMQMVSIKLHTAARCCFFICRLSSTHAKQHVFHTDSSEACQKAFCYLWFYMVECAHMFKWVSEWKTLSARVRWCSVFLVVDRCHRRTGNATIVGSLCSQRSGALKVLMSECQFGEPTYV